MPADPVDVVLARLEGKIDVVVATLSGEQARLQDRVDSLERSRNRVVGVLTAIIVAFISTGLIALAHIP